MVTIQLIEINIIQLFIIYYIIYYVIIKIHIDTDGK